MLFVNKQGDNVMNKINQIILLIFLSLVFVACGPNPEELAATANAAATATQLAIPTATPTPEPLPDPVVGEQIFNTKYLELSGNSCNSCHKVDDSDRVGNIPLVGIARYGGERVEGLSAEEYIRQSILDPRAYAVEGFDPEGMPEILGDILSEEEINHLIAYVMSL